VWQVIRDLSGIDPREDLGSDMDVLAIMCQHRLVNELLSMLRALPPITKTSGVPAATPAGHPLAAYPSDIPYQGYRSDLVAGELPRVETASGGPERVCIDQ
jgi:hypothetical protein